MSHDLDFLELTEEGKKIFADPEKHYQPFKELYDPLPDEEWGSPSQVAIEKFIQMLNILYWTRVDNHQGESVSAQEFKQEFFSQYFSLQEAIDAIIRVKYGAAPIWGLHDFIKKVTDDYQTFPVKKCDHCQSVGRKGYTSYLTSDHLKTCNLCQQTVCYHDIGFCYTCRNYQICQNCLRTIENRPLPQDYIGKNYTQCKDCDDNKN